MTSRRVTDSATALTSAGGTIDHFSDPLHLWLIRELASGHPVTRNQAEQAAARLTSDPAEALARLDAHCEHNDAGDITGLGLTLNPTAHQVTIDDGARMWAWCAMDTLELAVLLGKQITITSAPPAPGGAVRLHASPAGAGGPARTPRCISRAARARC